MSRLKVYWVDNLPNGREGWQLYSLTTMRWLKLQNRTKKSKLHVHCTIVRNEATGTHINWNATIVPSLMHTVEAILAVCCSILEPLTDYCLLFFCQLPLDSPKSDAKLQLILLVKHIEKLKPIPPENRVSRKTTDCLCDDNWLCKWRL